MLAVNHHEVMEQSFHGVIQQIKHFSLCQPLTLISLVSPRFVLMTTQLSGLWNKFKFISPFTSLISTVSI